MSVEPLTYYKNYWAGAEEVRNSRNYYGRLYHRVLHLLKQPIGIRVIDIAGGNGQFMSYLGIKDATIFDISQSGLETAKRLGFNTIFCDVEKRFPIEDNSYEVAFCFEVLEHLKAPCKTLSEINNILKIGGTLYIGQPNMRADGIHHVRRYYKKPLLNDLEKSGFKVEWIEYVPAYSMRDSIISDIKNNPSVTRKLIQLINLFMSFLPYSMRYILAKTIPDRFALMFIVKAIKI